MASDFKLLITTVLAGSGFGPTGVSVSTSVHTLIAEFQKRDEAERAAKIINAANAAEAVEQFNRTAIKLYE